MTPAWAQRREELLSDCIVSPDVFTCRYQKFIRRHYHAAACCETSVRCALVTPCEVRSRFGDASQPVIINASRRTSGIPISMGESA